MSYCFFSEGLVDINWCKILCDILKFFKILPEEKCEHIFCGVDQPKFCQDANEASCNNMFPNDETLITDLPFLHSTDFEKDSNVSN